MANFFTAEKGFKIEVSIVDETGVAIDLTGVTVSYNIQKPNSLTITKSGADISIPNPATGVTSYTTTANDNINDIEGSYRIQPKIVLGNGNIFYGTVVEMTLENRIS